MSRYVAKPFIAGSPQAEVLGATMSAFLDNVESDVIRPILEKHNIPDLDPEGWYSHQLWMDILKDIQDTLGVQASTSFVAFGREVVRKAAMPDSLQTIPDVLNALHAIHHANLRNVPEEEGYFVEKIEDNLYHVYHNTPNPDDAIYGFIWGLAARFKKRYENFTVTRIDNDKPEIARSLFEVKWWR